MISWFGSLDGLCHDATTVFIAVSDDAAGLIDGTPFEMSVFGHRLTPELLAIYHEFHLVAIAVGPEVDFLALVSLQIPVGEDV